LEATKSLWQISQDRLAPEFLLRIVENGNDERRRQAVFPLAEMKCDPAMIPRLRRVCDDPDRGIGHYAIDALATVGREAVAELIGLMRRHPDEDFRRSAAGHLCRMGRNAIEAAPALMEAMWEDDAVIGWQIADFFADLGKDSKPFLSEFLCSLEHEDCGVRWHAMRALVKLRPWVPDAVERIAEQFSNLDESDLSAAIDIAAAIGPDAKFAIPMLRRAMIEGESHVRFSAAVAHWIIQPEDHVYSLMREAMSWPAVSTEAAVWAWRIGREEAALPILVNRYTYPAGGFGCGHAAMDWYRGYFPAVEAIQESLNDRQQRVRDLAKAAMEEIRPTRER
jgi:HEAT repeat protein